jgi:DNA polymerase
MLIGEAPGIEESRTGRPFVGRSGKFLMTLLTAIGLKRSALFITSPVKYYPGKRALKLTEIRHGATHTQKQIEVITPKVIILLGNVAIKAVLGEKLKVSDIHGRILQKGGVTIIPTFHPSAAMRFPTIRAKMRQDFITIHRYLSENLQ